MPGRSEGIRQYTQRRIAQGRESDFDVSSRVTDKSDGVTQVEKTSNIYYCQKEGHVYAQKEETGGAQLNHALCEGQYTFFTGVAHLDEHEVNTCQITSYSQPQVTT